MGTGMVEARLLSADNGLAFDAGLVLNELARTVVRAPPIWNGDATGNG